MFNIWEILFILIHNNLFAITARLSLIKSQYNLKSFHDNLDTFLFVLQWCEVTSQRHFSLLQASIKTSVCSAFLALAAISNLVKNLKIPEFEEVNLFAEKISHLVLKAIFKFITLKYPSTIAITHLTNGWTFQFSWVSVDDAFKEIKKLSTRIAIHSNASL